MLTKNFIEFYTPGSFLSNVSSKEVDSWDVDQAIAFARKAKRENDVIPHSFRFITRGRKDGDLDSKIVKESPIYILGGKILTYEEVKARNDPKDYILLSNMRNNDYQKVVENTNSWKVVLPLTDDMVYLDVTLEGGDE